MLVSDDCLTNLNWLVHQQPALPLSPPTPPSTPPNGQYAVISRKQIEYSKEAIKPPYSYAQLITMAMQANNGEKMVLTDIYNWIKNNFAFFRSGDNSWQNSIRHNLSLNKQFLKVPRDPDDKGKGSYWMLDPRNKDPYCIRRRNFIETHSRRQRPFVTRPQVNPAIKSFLEKTRRMQESREHPFSGTGERLEDIGAQECVYTDAKPCFDDFNQKLFKREVETYAYVPQNDLLSPDPHATPVPAPPTNPEERVRVEYNWEGYEYHPSNLIGVQLPLLQNNNQEMTSLVGSVGLSPTNTDETETQAGLDLRIPTPEWWGNQVTTASLLSPSSSSQNYLARVFENLSSSGNSEAGGLMREHPWQERNGHPDDDGLFQLEPMVPTPVPTQVQ